MNYLKSELFPSCEFIDSSYIVKYKDKYFLLPGFRLLNQAYIFDDTKTVADFIKESIAKTGENITVRQFKRIELGVTE